jgi:hypothetical protein
VDAAAIAAQKRPHSIPPLRPGEPKGGQLQVTSQSHIQVIAGSEAGMCPACMHVRRSVL